MTFVFEIFVYKKILFFCLFHKNRKLFHSSLRLSYEFDLWIYCCCLSSTFFLYVFLATKILDFLFFSSGRNIHKYNEMRFCKCNKLACENSIRMMIESYNFLHFHFSFFHSFLFFTEKILSWCREMKKTWSFLCCICLQALNSFHHLLCKCNFSISMSCSCAFSLIFFCNLIVFINILCFKFNTNLDSMDFSMNLLSHQTYDNMKFQFVSRNDNCINFHQKILIKIHRDQEMLRNKINFNSSFILLFIFSSKTHTNLFQHWTLLMIKIFQISTETLTFSLLFHTQSESTKKYIKHKNI